MTGLLRRVALALLFTLSVTSAGLAQAAAGDSTLLTVKRIYGSPDFRPQQFGPARWLDGGVAYTTVEPSKEFKDGQDIVKYDAESGTRTILVAAARLVPPGFDRPLEIEDYSWSADGRQLLVFTNSQPVWRTNTRGDYWTLNLDSWTLRKLGGDAKPSTLMFAKFSPDGGRVGYVNDFNVCVEDLATGAITRLTADGSRKVINGTFDWVYEEELGLRDGWRWSPDGKSIAFWQLVADRVRDFALINYTDSLYPIVTEVQYPKAGETNSAARIGVVPAAGGEIRWLALPGDPRNTYIARMDWAANSDEVAVQQLNRLQNTDVLFLGERTDGAVQAVYTEHDSAWVDVVDDFTWLDGGKRLPLDSASGTAGATPTCLAGRTPTRLVTPGAFDVTWTSPAWTRRAAGSTTSPRPTTRRSGTSSAPGSTARAKAERITPADRRARNAYNIAPDSKYAIHNHSIVRRSAGELDLVSLPAHATVRPLAANTDLRDKVAAPAPGPARVLPVDIGDGVKLDGWMMKPPDFDPTKQYPVLFYVYGEPAGADRARRLGRRELALAPDARAAGLPRGERRQPRHAGAQGSRLAEDGVRPDRRPRDAQDQAARRSCHRPVALRGLHADRDLGLERRRLVTLQRDVPASGCLQDGDGRGARAQRALYDTIYQERYMGLPQQNGRRYDSGSPITSRTGSRATCSWCTAPATTTCTTRAPSR